MDSTLYRPNVAAILLCPTPMEQDSSDTSNTPINARAIYFLAERIDMQGIWQFPQGGIDSGETPEDALLRELEEEIGTKEVEILAQYPEWISYDFPPHAVTKMRPYIGQRQKYFLARLLPHATIQLETAIPEFTRYEFVSYDEIFTRIKHFKREVYKQVLDFFQPVILSTLTQEKQHNEHADNTRKPQHTRGGTQLC